MVKKLQEFKKAKQEAFWLLPKNKKPAMGAPQV